VSGGRYAWAMIVYLNGEFLDRSAAKISPFDRGFLFGDGVYEGLRAFDGHVVAMGRHVTRMNEGLSEAGIGFDASALGEMTRELLGVNGLRDAFIYWQVTRGAPAPGQTVRSRIAPVGMTPTVFAYAAATPAIDTCRAPTPVRVVTVEDRRWSRGRLKSVSLLGNVLSAMESAERGGQDAILIRDGVVGEACSTNVVLVHRGADGSRKMVTPSLTSAPILAGVTRGLVMDLFPEIEERRVEASELEEADEILLLGTLSMVMSVVSLDGRGVGTGGIGPVAREVLAKYVEGIGAEQREGEGVWRRLGK
ncbi:MAG: aminotransferase class IV, partial [Phycisphaeraceae bacterium]|nr:aminotransferase class IV [Phycisphaeraceae bacterium]